MEVKNENTKTAVIYYCYNRLDHAQKSLPKIIEFKKDLPLFIFCDGAKKGEELEVNKVRSYISSYTKGLNHCEVIFRETNYNLAPNVISGVNMIFKNGYDSVMVLEDDCVPKQDFFSYMLKALKFYDSYPNVMHVSGFGMPLKTKINKDSYITPYPCSWGWGTWKDKWMHCNFEDEGAYQKILSNREMINLFDWSGKSFSYFLKLQLKEEVNSWLIRWYVHIFNKKGVSVWATNSKLENIGFDGTGKHKVKFDIFNQKNGNVAGELNFEESTKFNFAIIKEFRRYFMGPKLVNKLKTILYIKTGFIFDKVKDISYYNTDNDVRIQERINSK